MQTEPYCEMTAEKERILAKYQILLSNRIQKVTVSILQKVEAIKQASYTGDYVGAVDSCMNLYAVKVCHCSSET